MLLGAVGMQHPALAVPGEGVNDVFSASWPAASGGPVLTVAV